jgi:hypothetical protein
MPDNLTTSQEQAATALTGAELVRIVQGGNTRRTTVAGITNLALPPLEITATPRALSASDAGRTLFWMGAGNCVIQIPNNLPAGFTVSIYQLRTGKVSWVALSGANFIHDQGYTQTRAAGSVLGVHCLLNVGGSAAEGAVLGSLIA